MRKANFYCFRTWKLLLIVTHHLWEWPLVFEVNKELRGVRLSLILCNLVWGYFNRFWRWIYIMERGNGEGKATLYKGSAGSCSKPRQRGNNHDWVEQLINHFNFQVPGSHNRFCLCFYGCDVPVSERNQLPMSSSSMKLCVLPTEPLSFLMKFQTQYPASLGIRFQFSSRWWKLQATP